MLTCADQSVVSVFLAKADARQTATQNERGQKEISAAKVREVESQLSGAQTSLKAERLLLQQASHVDPSHHAYHTFSSPSLVSDSVYALH